MNAEMDEGDRHGGKLPWPPRSDKT
jgi:hypothetical protein